MSVGMRAFIAIEIPADLRQSLRALQEDLGRQGFRARWTAPANIHLTLKFLGQIPVGHVAGLAAALETVAAPVKPFRMQAAGLGVFPDLRRPRILWVGVSGARAELVALHRRLEDTLAALAFPREERAFRGHLTLARFAEKSAQRLPAETVKPYGAAVFGEIPARELVLFQSDLTPGGPVYKALARAQLAGSSAPDYHQTEAPAGETGRD